MELRGDGSKKELYLGVIKAMDLQFAPLFGFIRGDAKLRYSTYIIVTSDNGPVRGAGNTGPFRGRKGSLYEGGLRAPFIVWGPRFIPERARGTANDKTVVSGVDLLPSVLSLAKVAAPTRADFDGIDLSAALTGKSQPQRNRPLFWLRPPVKAGRARLEQPPDLAIRDNGWKLLIRADGSGAQLYDLAKDPGETTNPAGQHSDVMARLRARLLDWNKSLQ